jgi:hypothetical protein
VAAAGGGAGAARGDDGEERDAPHVLTSGRWRGTRPR